MSKINEYFFYPLINEMEANIDVLIPVNKIILLVQIKNIFYLIEYYICLFVGVIYFIFSIALYIYIYTRANIV